MGRQFEVRKRAMFARYDRMAKAFTRVGREIVIAVKAGGPDPDSNPALRRAIQNGRSVNMPKDRIEGAIKRALGKDAENFDEITYEGFGPHGTAIVIDTATNNPTRTIADLKLIFNKNGGNMGVSGSVVHQFTKMGVFKVDPEGLELDELELELIDFGLEEIVQGEDDDGNELAVLRCQYTDFGSLQDALEERKIESKSSGLEWIAGATVSLSEDEEMEVLQLVDLLEANDDVQQVFHNLA